RPTGPFRFSASTSIGPEISPSMKIGALYLSSGNTIPGKLYKVVGGGPQKLYEHSLPIKGFVVKGGQVYFADWHESILLHDLATLRVATIYSNPSRFTRLSDVGFRP
ncbi:MAG: hypothetical protein ABDI20_05785, partial [Candidatus Bipolaricaulaceae bacterium]